jgi:hypothetical protein
VGAEPTRAAAFAPEPPADLVLPAAGSTTARAIHSLGQRALFEWLKHGPFVADAGPAFDALRATIAGFLPGRPKVVSALLDEPSVATPLRRLRAGRGDARDGAVAAAQAFFVLHARGALEAEVSVAGAPRTLFCVDPLASVALPDDTATIAFTPGGLFADGRPVARAAHAFAMPIEGRSLVAVAGAEVFEPETTAPRSSSASAPLGHAELVAWVHALRDGLDLLRAVLPGVAAALERVVRVAVPTGEAPGTARLVTPALAVVFLPREGDRAAHAESLGRATAATLVRALGELDPLGPADAIEALVHAAEAAVGAALFVGLARARLREADAGREASRREAFAAAHAGLAAHEDRLTPVARGIVDELERTMRHHRAT